MQKILKGFQFVLRTVGLFLFCASVLMFLAGFFSGFYTSKETALTTFIAGSLSLFFIAPALLLCWMGGLFKETKRIGHWKKN